MPQTKDQKRAGAIARNRLMFPKKIQNWLDCQPGGVLYQNYLKFDGLESAEQQQKLAEQRLVKAAYHARVDRYGNPL